LLLSGIYRKDGQLVELNAVQEGRPGTSRRALVGTSINPDPGVLGVHFVNNLVPLGLQIADDKQMEHLECLLGFGDCKDLLALRISLYLESVCFQSSFAASVSSSGIQK
jgi:hypothetical protein